MAPATRSSQPKKITEAIVARTAAPRASVPTRMRTMPSPSSQPRAFLTPSMPDTATLVAMTESPFPERPGTARARAETERGPFPCQADLCAERGWDPNTDRLTHSKLAELGIEGAAAGR